MKMSCAFMQVVDSYHVKLHQLVFPFALWKIPKCPKSWNCCFGKNWNPLIYRMILSITTEIFPLHFTFHVDERNQSSEKAPPLNWLLDNLFRDRTMCNWHKLFGAWSHRIYNLVTSKFFVYRRYGHFDFAKHQF